MLMKNSPVIAFMDDDPDNRLYLKRAFDECRQDLRIHFFTAGDDLLDYLKQSSKGSEKGGTPDLIIISLHLPGKTTLKLIKEIKTNPDLRHIPLIVLNGAYSDPEIRQCYDLGANTVMGRPVLFPNLVEALKQLCDYWLGPVRM
jgi:two-component system, response regulator